VRVRLVSGAAAQGEQDAGQNGQTRPARIRTRPAPAVRAICEEGFARMPALTPRQTAEQFLRATLSPDPGDLADFYAPEIVIEMPFAPAGLYPARIESTREELRARFRAGAAARRYRDLRDVVIHETADPGVVIVEYGLGGEMTESAEPFSLRFVMVMTIRDGQIVHTRDYADPIAGARALGRVPQLLAALTGDQPG
jgi:ketosteroid isomerase-like protein